MTGLNELLGDMPPERRAEKKYTLTDEEITCPYADDAISPALQEDITKIRKAIYRWLSSSEQLPAGPEGPDIQPTLDLISEHTTQLVMF